MWRPRNINRTLTSHENNGRVDGGSEDINKSRPNFVVSYFPHGICLTLVSNWIVPWEFTVLYPQEDSNVFSEDFQ
ncbi:hypothetical protein CEXT_83691 [Caerostris extrusa]|uniref:Uncharacterized protein n=1 Tax=Caerostris extrusa TaxID=172846 RepID=A0AAV4REI4_CAEEX|nr:hypothetical protein CEXT_83691 [Caerostris extrusa]